MRKIKLLFTAAVALVTFAALASSASAFDAVPSETNISAESNGGVTFGSSPQIICNLTLDSTLNGSIEVRAGAALGAVHNVDIAECAGGSVSAVLGLDGEGVWPMDVVSIEGTAPDELSGFLFDIHNAAFNLSVFGGFINCLYRGDAGAELLANALGGGSYEAEIIYALEEVLLPQAGGSSLCPDEGGFAGEFEIAGGLDIQVE